MNHGPAAALGPSLDRRGFFGTIALGGAAIALPVRGALAAHLLPAGSVVGFHNDAPWLDVTGRDLPYRPPHGAGAPTPDDERLARLGFFL